jgi:integrase
MSVQIRYILCGQAADTETAMAHTEKLSDGFAEAAAGPPKDGKRAYIVYYDPETRGLGLRVTKAGAKSWVLNYRAGGVERRLTIGTFKDPWRAAAARKEAQRLKALVDQGRDPMGERHEDRRAPIVNDLIARWREDEAPKNRESTTRENESLIRQWIAPELGSRKVADVTPGDVDALHRKISRRGTKYRANRVAALGSRLFALAVRWEMTDVNPFRGVQRNAEVARASYLDAEQLERLLAALPDHPNKKAADAIRLLVLTGARSAEVFGASWAQFDLVAGIWTKPSAAPKTGRTHRVPLSAPAVELLTEIRATTSSTVVFPGLRSVRHDWQKICQAAGLEGVRVHDLRHSFASFLASSGLGLPVIGQLLGHTQAQTTHRYAHLLDAPLREATGKVGALVTSLERKGSRS